MRIAIIGSGISGMSAAYFLRKNHEVTVFEAGNYIGGHTNTIEFTHQQEAQAIDTGFIVFNDRTYPNFIALLWELEVPYQPTGMSFSVACEASGLEYRGAGLNGLFAQRSNLLRPGFWRLLSEMLRFNRTAEALLEPLPADITVGDFFRRHFFGQSFREQFFLPMASAIWSCPNDTVEQFPMRFIVEFYRHHGLLSVTNRPQWYVIRGGSQQYMRKLTAASGAKILLNSAVLAIDRQGGESSPGQPATGEVVLTVADQSAGSQRMPFHQHHFDHVIFACHSDQALKILGTAATPVEREILGAFPYERNEAVLHTDETLLPKSRRAWACWNYHLPKNRSEKATVTYNMNLLQGLSSPTTFCVSLNCTSQIDPDQIIRKIEYHHPIFTTQRRPMQARQAELLGSHRTSFVGAYWGNGFHEDGVVSALAACHQINETAKVNPWKVASTKAGFDTDDTPPSKTAFASESA